NAKTGAPLEKIMRRCLEKKAALRFQSASDLRFALEVLSTPSSSALTTAPNEIETTKRGRWRERFAWIAAALAALAVIGIGYFHRSAGVWGPVRLNFVPPANVAFINTLTESVVVSPDGQKLVFTGYTADGKRQLWWRPLGSEEAQPLPGTNDALYPFWAPDSR